MAAKDPITAFVRNKRKGLIADTRQDILSFIDDLAVELNISDSSGEPDLAAVTEPLLTFVDDPSQVEDSFRAAIRRLLNRLSPQQQAKFQAKLEQWIKELENNLLQRLPSGVRPLLQPIEDLQPTAQRWPWRIGSSGVVQLIDGIPLQLNAAASASLGMEVLPLSKVAALKGHGLGGNLNKVMQYQFGGEVKAGAGSSGFFGGGRFALKGDASGGVNFTYHYLQKGSRRLISVLARDLSHFPSPFSLDEIWAAGQQHLGQIIYGVNGSLQLGLKLSASASYHTSVGRKDKFELPVTAEAGLAFEANLQRSGRYKITTRPLASTGDGAHQVEVLLQSVDRKQQDMGLSFDAGINVSGIDKIVTPLLREKLPEVQHLVDLVDELARPGDWIRDKLAQELAATKLDGLPKEVLSAFLNDKKQVSQTILTAVNQAVDRVVWNFSQALDLQLAKLTTELKASLPLDKARSDQVVQWLLPKLKRKLGQWETALENKVERFKQAPLQKLKPLFKRFDLAEAEFDRILKHLDQRAKELLAPVRRVLTRYQEFRSRVLKRAASITSVNVSISIGSSWSKLQQRNADLKFVLDPDSPTARKLHRRMAYGQYAEAIESGRNPAKKFITLNSGKIEQLLQNANHSFFNLTWGSNRRSRRITVESFAQSGIRVSHDAVSGNIQLEGGQGLAAGQVKALHRRKSAAFIHQLLLLARASEPGHRLVNSVSVELKFADERMQAGELKTYLHSAFDAGLLSQTNRDAMEDAYRAFLNQNLGSAVSVQVELVLAMPPDLFQKVGQIAKSKSSRVRRAAIRSLLQSVPQDHVREEMLQIARRLGKSKSAVVNLASAAAGTSTVIKQVMRLLLREYRKYKSHTDPDFSESDILGPVFVFRRLAWMAVIADGFLQTMQSLGQLWELDPNLESDVEQAAKLQAEAIKKIKPWTKSGIDILWNDRIPPRNLALVTVLSELAELEQPLVGILSQWEGQDSPSIDQVFAM